MYSYTNLGEIGSKFLNNHWPIGIELPIIFLFTFLKRLLHYILYVLSISGIMSKLPPFHLPEIKGTQLNHGFSNLKFYVPGVSHWPAWSTVTYFSHPAGCCITNKALIITNYNCSKKWSHFTRDFTHQKKERERFDSEVFNLFTWSLFMKNVLTVHRGPELSLFKRCLKLA